MCCYTRAIKKSMKDSLVTHFPTLSLLLCSQLDSFSRNKRQQQRRNEQTTARRFEKEKVLSSGRFLSEYKKNLANISCVLLWIFKSLLLFTFSRALSTLLLLHDKHMSSLRNKQILLCVRNLRVKRVWKNHQV